MVPGTACPICGFFSCVCNVRRRHAEDCKFRIAMAMPVAIECDHGYDVCPTCDPCTCGVNVETEDFGGES